MLIRQSSFHGGEISPQLYSRTDVPARTYAVRTLRNFIPTTTGAALNRSGFKYVTAVKDQTRRARLVPFTFSTDQAYLLEFGHLYVRVYQGGALITEVVTTYTDVELPKLQFVQYADTLTLTHPNHAAAELKRTGASTWTLTDVTTARTTTVPTNLRFSTGFTPQTTGDDTHQAKYWEWVYTAVNKDTGEESMPSTPFTATGGVIVVAPDRPVSLQGDGANAIASAYYWYRGRYGIWGFIGSSAAFQPSFVDEGQVPNYSDRPPQALAPFASPENPYAATYFQQRLWFANQPSSPQRILASKTGRFKDFDTSIPQKKDDGLDFTIASRMYEEIRAMVGMNQLVILTANSEYVVDSGNGAVAFDAFQVVPIGYNGCSWVRPLTVNDSILYVTPQQSFVRELVYGGLNGWSASEVSVVAGHLLSAAGRTIEEWAFQKTPFSTVWAVRDDGTLLSITYDAQLKVQAWARHDSAGDACESVACIPEGTEDALYAIFRRTVNGATVRYIERLQPRHTVSTSSAGNFLDASVVSSGQTITGLSHLEGRQVYALRDGVVEGPITVVGGSVTLSASGAIVFVGLQITADIELLDLTIPSNQYAPSDSGPDQKLVSRVAWEVDRTAGLKAGESLDVLSPWVKPLGYAMPPEGLTHDLFVVPVESGWNRGGRAALRQDMPLPVTVMAAIREVQVGGI